MLHFDGFNCICLVNEGGTLVYVNIGIWPILKCAANDVGRCVVNVILVLNEDVASGLLHLFEQSWLAGFFRTVIKKETIVNVRSTCVERFIIWDCDTLYEGPDTSIIL